VLSGNTSDKTALKDFLKKIGEQSGKAQRVWVMDRGIPTEEVPAQMRASDPPVRCLVGTPKGRLSQYEQKLLAAPWQEVRAGVSVKLLAQEQEGYVLARSQDRVNKERALRRRQLKSLWKRRRELQGMKLKPDALMEKVGAAKPQHPAGAALGVLPATFASGGSLPQPQGRPVVATGLSPKGGSDRSAPFRGLPGVLPARDLAGDAAPAGAGADTASGAGKVQSRGDD
jgi:hypothetical protein